MAVFLLYLAILVGLRAAFPDKSVVMWGVLLASVAAFVAIALKKWLPRTESVSSEIDSPLAGIPTAYDAESEVPADSVARHLVQTLGFDPVLVFMVLAIIVPSLFMGAGWAEARGDIKRHYFHDLASKDEYVVLRIFGMTAVAAIFAPETRKCERRYVVRDLSQVGVLTPTSAQLDGCKSE